VILTLLGLIVAHDESPYRNQPEAAVTVTDVEPGAGWKGSRRRGCDSSWFQVTSDDGRTGYFRDCADRYWEGRWIAVRWNQAAGWRLGEEVGGGNGPVRFRLVDIMCIIGAADTRAERG
jgi:uncharacterized protein (DUF736 family)